jgi:hypothetical protein
MDCANGLTMEAAENMQLNNFSVDILNVGTFAENKNFHVSK